MLEGNVDEKRRKMQIVAGKLRKEREMNVNKLKRKKRKKSR